MRKIIITGNVGRDPETRSMPSGDSFVVFTVAVNAGTKANPKTDWMEVTANGKLGEIVVNYVRKGTKVLVEGAPSVNAYINKENKAVGTLRIYANNIELLSSREQSTSAPIPGEDFAIEPVSSNTNNGFNAPGSAGLASDDVPF